MIKNFGMMSFNDVKYHRETILKNLNNDLAEESLDILLDELLKMRKDKYEMVKSLAEKMRGSHAFTVPNESFN